MDKDTPNTCSHSDHGNCGPWCGRDPKKGRLLGIYFDPPMAIARVGGSREPMPAYRWKLDENPSRGVQTMIEPAPSLIETSVKGNGHHPYTLKVETPNKVVFKDRHGRIKPVAPFFELWARVQDSDGSVVKVPVTAAFL